MTVTEPFSLLVAQIIMEFFDIVSFNIVSASLLLPIMIQYI